jgi:DNA processing protein
MHSVGNSGNAMQSINESLIKIALELTLLPGVGKQAQIRIWKTYPNILNLFKETNKYLEALGMPAEAVSMLRSRAFQAAAAEIFDWGVREDCRFLIHGSPEYPPLLDEIYDPPLVLYGRGRLEILTNPCISIVGTRKPTVYGMQMAQGIAADVGGRGIVIVSGLARGIDAAAHRGCLEGGGTTIAVLGCGIDIVYPKEHKLLAQKILENGLLISEFPPGASPSPQNFPIRNRIISGLSWGTLIVEAREYSGSLITARLAMEQNRELFAIPGNLTSPQSFGSNFLIKQGAKLVQSWRDIIEELPSEIRQEIFSKEDAKPSAPELELLSQEELNLVNLLKQDEATQFDKLFKSSSLQIPRLCELLLKLETGGWIRQLPGNLYIRTRK